MRLQLRGTMYKLPDNNCVISFSGGRTSAFMLKQIMDYNDGLPGNAVICFANTGREMTQTLKFINDCSLNWGLEIVWLEYDLNEENKHIFKIVDIIIKRITNQYGKLIYNISIIKNQININNAPK